jgi:uncharacterized protein YkwD
LADIGRAHSSDMREHGFFDHVSPTFGNLENRVDRALPRLRMWQRLKQACSRAPTTSKI